VGKSGKHYVIELADLSGYLLGDVRVRVPVNGYPPRRYGIQVSLAGFGKKQAAFAPHDGNGHGRRLHLGIRVPDYGGITRS
jgi:hypothetical protein